MSDRRFAALPATEAVMPAVMRFSAALVRSIMPKVNWGILARAPVGVQLVRAMELVQIRERTKIRGSATMVVQYGTPYQVLAIHAVARARIGRPMNETLLGSSMWASGSSPVFLRLIMPLKALMMTAGLATRATREPTTMMPTPHQM